MSQDPQYHEVPYPTMVGASPVMHVAGGRHTGPPSIMLPLLRDLRHGTVTVKAFWREGPQGLEAVTVTPRITAEVDTKVRRHTGILKPARDHDKVYIDRTPIQFSDVLAVRVLKVEVTEPDARVSPTPPEREAEICSGKS